MPRAAAKAPLVAAALVAAVLCGDAAPARLADADDAALVIRGKQVYAAQCASCHGRYLQGQPLWRMADADRHRRAPALSGAGPGWMRSDQELIAAVSVGRPSDSSMPEFGRRLPQADILAVVAFIKARWPIAMRVSQAALNPGGAGRPLHADGDWRFPPDCPPLNGP